MLQLEKDKNLLHQTIVSALESIHQVTLKAAQQAYETATNNETKAENKYDTFGLEASYLAQGQSQRVEQHMNDIEVFKNLAVTVFKTQSAIGLGTLVGVTNEKGGVQSYFLSPVSGGLKITFQHKEIILITPTAPLGKALMGANLDDEITLIDSGNQLLTISALT